MSKRPNKTANAFLALLTTAEVDSIQPVARALGRDLDGFTVRELQMSLDLFHTTEVARRRDQAAVFARTRLAKQLLGTVFRRETERWAQGNPAAMERLKREVFGDPSADDLLDRQGIVGVARALIALFADDIVGLTAHMPEGTRDE